MAGSAPLVAWADAPEAIILCLRMAFAALALGVVFLRRPMIADWRRPGAAWRLILMAAMSSLTLLLFFYAVRHTSVAIAMFLLFLMPVWVALAAPRLFKSPREPIVWPALGLALAGLAVILLPDLLGEGVKLSLAGLLAALFTGFGYATYTVSVKGLTKIVAPSTISMAEAAGDTLLVLPLALWQFSSTGYQLDGRPGSPPLVMGVSLHGDPVHALDRGHQARARGARDHPRLHRAGGRTALRGVPRRPDADRLDDRSAAP